MVPGCLLIMAGPTLAIRRWIGRHLIKTSFLLMGMPIHVHGYDGIPPGTALCVSNHCSYLDGLLLTAALPGRFSFLVQHGAAEWPLVGPTIRRMGVSFVNRGAAREAAGRLRELIRRVDAGESLAIFPEGTFDAEPGLKRFHDGAFLMATKTGVPVVPAVITGSRRALPDGAKCFRPSRIDIRFLPAIASEGQSPATLGRAARATILNHCQEPDRCPSPP